MEIFDTLDGLNSFSEAQNMDDLALIEASFI